MGSVNKSFRRHSHHSVGFAPMSGIDCDASLQSTQTKRRRFQRRGSKSASMFKAMSAGSMGTSDNSLDTKSWHGQITLANQMFSQSAVRNEESGDDRRFSLMSIQQIPNDSVRSCLTSGSELSSSTATALSDADNEAIDALFG